jgi:hypothetical protein
MSIWKGIFLILGIKSPLSSKPLKLHREIPALAIPDFPFPIPCPFIPMQLLCMVLLRYTLSTHRSLVRAFSSSNHIAVRHFYVIHQTENSSSRDVCPFTEYQQA